LLRHRCKINLIKCSPTRDSGRLPGRADTRISYTSILQL